MLRRFAVPTATIAVLSAAPVHAASVDALQLLTTFNTIALGDLNAGVHTEGTVYVGGNLNLSGGYDVNSDEIAPGQAGDVSGALVVGGDINGGTINFVRGDVVIGGANNSTINAANSVTTGANVPVSEVSTALKDLSADLASRTATPGSSVDTDQHDLNIFSGSGIDGLSIVFADAGFLSRGGSNNRFSGIDTSLTTVVNIAGRDVTLGANIEATLFDTVLLNFFEAETLNITAGASFSIFAPNAVVTVGGGGVNGTVVGQTIFQNSEIRPFNDNNVFAGTLPTGETNVSAVPLPASVFLLLGAFAGLLGLRRRKVA